MFRNSTARGDIDDEPDEGSLADVDVAALREREVSTSSMQGRCPYTHDATSRVIGSACNDQQSDSRVCCGELASVAQRILATAKEA